MKLDGMGQIAALRAAAAKKRSSATGGASFDSFLQETGETGETTATHAPATTAPLFLAQEVDDALHRTARAKRRGMVLLDGLEDIRTGLLTGTLSPSRLQLLARQLETERDSDLPPQLAGILDDIELRVAVELAKYGV